MTESQEVTLKKMNVIPELMRELIRKVDNAQTELSYLVTSHGEQKEIFKREIKYVREQIAGLKNDVAGQARDQKEHLRDHIAVAELSKAKTPSKPPKPPAGRSKVIVAVVMTIGSIGVALITALLAGC
jgi:hypothetical protein